MITPNVAECIVYLPPARNWAGSCSFLWLVLWGNKWQARPAHGHYSLNCTVKVLYLLQEWQNDDIWWFRHIMHGKLKHGREVRRLLSLKFFPLTREIVDMLYMFCFNNLHNTFYDPDIKKSENRDAYVMINT